MKKIINIIFIISLIISNLYVPKVKAKTLGELKRELEQYEKEYNENKDKNKLNEEEKQKIKNNINSIGLEITEIGLTIDSLNEEISLLNEEIKEKEQEIEDILLFTQISNGESAYLEYAFGAKDFTDFIYRIAVSEQLTTYNNNLVLEYKQNIEDNKTKTLELEDKKIELSKKQKSLNEQLIKIQSSMDEIDEYNLSVEEKIKLQKSYIQMYTEKGCKDDEDLDKCGKEFLPADTSFWRPIKEGYITSWFGSRDCTDPKVSCFHWGLDMSTTGSNNNNVPIYPIANGVVIQIVELTYNSSTGKYNKQPAGRRIYIEHLVNGKRYISGYLHLRTINVKKGDVVTKDTQIGIMGGYPPKEYWDTASTGAHLHLEISTGTFTGNQTYYSYRTSPTNYINFPKTKYTTWYDRITKIKG